MPIFQSQIDTASDEFKKNREEMLELVSEVRELENEARDRGLQAAERFHSKGRLLPRERLAALLDPGAPVLELGNVAGYDLGGNSVPGGGSILVIGYVSGTRCVIGANDSAVNAGALTVAGGWKLVRGMGIALENRLPYIVLVESAGADLLGYRVENWHEGGRMFAMQARLSAAGIPVIAVQHGSGTAGGAYLPGMSDVVIGVKKRGFAFLAGPPLLKAATGEVAEAEELGGMEMHASVSGLVEHLAEDDADALRICREVVANLDWGPSADSGTTRDFDPPAYDPDELAGVVPVDVKKPYDCREVIARIVDGSELLEFKPGFGPATVCVEASIYGHEVGIIANNGALDNAGASKATHFIQRCTQLGVPLVFLQNITGYMVGVEAERGGMVKNGSKMIQAVTTADVPKFTLIIGASFGAGNYGMCGTAYDPRLIMSWPNARLGVMGAAQAAETMRIVAAEKTARSGQPMDEAALEEFAKSITDLFESQESALVNSGRLCDDGLLDPRDTRRMLGFSLSMAAEAAETDLNPLSFGVGRI